MPHPALFDFDLAISMEDPPHCTVAVLRSPAGEARITTVLPAVPAVIQADPLAAPLAAVRAYGTDLFDAAISGEVRSRYDVSRQLATDQGAGLRIRLRVGSAALLNVAWELLYDTRVGEFVALSRHTPLVRYVEIPQPVRPLAVEPPLRILGLVANPAGVAPLDIEREKAHLATAINPLRKTGAVELVWLEGQSWRTLQQALQGGPWHIFHFVGHAGFDERAGEGFLLLAGEQNEIAPLYATELARLLADQESLRLAVLNACEGAQSGEHLYFSSTASILVRRGLPAVLAMQYVVSDEAAIEFTRSFYGALTAALPVDAAVSEARKAMSLSRPGLTEWPTPVLYMRAPDGVLWQSRQQENEMEQSKKPAWWDQLPDQLGSFETGDIGGSVIIGTVGAGAKNVAIGQNITQIISESLGPHTPDDRAIIAAQVQRVIAALDATAIEPRTLGRAEANLETLQNELTKTGDGEQPDANTITRVGDWLLDNVPELVQILSELFGLPAVGRVLSKAGEEAIQWVRQRFSDLR
jgi:hypothetical protein